MLGLTWASVRWVPLLGAKGKTMKRPIQKKSKSMTDSSTPSAVSHGRHAAECKICSHLQREEIERDFVNWRSPAAITKHYGLRNRSSVYRHAHAIGLFPKRQRNVRAALEKIIERAGEVGVTAPANYSPPTDLGAWQD